jgi:hypothetical protein
MKSCAVFPTAALMLAVLLIAASINFDKNEARRDHGFGYSADLEKEAIAYDQPAEANEFFLLKRSPDGHSPVPVQRYLDAIERMKRMPQYSTANRTGLPSK